MALINCKNCGKQISDKAAACPHCGSVLWQNSQAGNGVQAKSGSKKPVIIGSVIAVAACVAAMLVVALTRNGSDVQTVGNNTSYAANSMIVYDNNSTAQPTQGPVNDPAGLGNTGGSTGSATAGSEAETEYYNITFVVEVKDNIVAANYPVDLCIDGETVATIGDGERIDHTYRLSKGLHKITFKNNKEPNNSAYTYECTETVTGQYSTITYVIKRHTAGGNKFTGTKGIDVKDRSYS